MSVIIKGMNMSSSCQSCKLKRFVGSRVISGCKPEVLYECPICDGLFALKDKRPQSCKLEQLPTPHGDLIDRDHLLSLIEGWNEDVENDKQNENSFVVGKVLNGVIRIIRGAHSVIEEEE